MIICGDALAELRKMPDGSVNCCVSSPPYWGLRDYGVAGQLGLERTPEEYVAKLVAVFREVRRILRDDGTLWVNLGDSYASSGRSDRKESPGVGAKQEMRAPGRSLKWVAGGGHNFSWHIPSFGIKIKPKDLVGIPWRVAFALQADGWYLRQDIIWAKPNPMPESVRDRCTKAHEYIFMLSKSARYWYDAEVVAEPSIRAGDIPGGSKKTSILQPSMRVASQKMVAETRNLRSVWPIATRPYAEAHFATFPPEIPERCIKAGCPAGGTVLDPFFGAGTTGLVAKRLGREFIGIELNPAYVEMAKRRIYGPLMMATESLPSE